MVKFFLGQRVKVVSVDGYAPNSGLIGVEGVVNELGCEWDSVSGIRNDGIGVTMLGADDWAFGEWQLEPILPEGAQPSKFSFTELMDNLGVVVA